MKKAFHLYLTADGMFWFHVRSVKGEIIVHSKKYKTRAGALFAMRSLFEVLTFKKLPIPFEGFTDHTYKGK